jgi:ATP-dependent exoDNAse (exonuclease V) beta subunit
MNIHKELSVFKKIKYHDEPHVYYVGEQKLISGTSFIGLYKDKFESEKMAEKTAKKRGIPVEEVLAEWEFKGGISRTKGTLVHAFAENYWLNKIFPVDEAKYEEQYPTIIERYELCKKLFLDFYKDASKALCPVVMELVVGDEEIGIGGMVDCLFWNESTNSYEIWDYKTNKEINTFSKYKKRMKAPINFLHECEFETYSIQLNLYKYIIEKNTNIKIGKLWLIHLHEDQEKYNLIQCADYQDIIKLLIKHFKQSKQ